MICFGDARRSAWIALQFWNAPGKYPLLTGKEIALSKSVSENDHPFAMAGCPAGTI
jgi:hypothetical protein